MAFSTIEIYAASQNTARLIATLENISYDESVMAVKKRLAQKLSFSVDRIALRLDAKGRNLKDEQIIQDLNLPLKGAQLYFRDLGPQISWKTVFLLEYFGPLVIYPLFYLRLPMIYWPGASRNPMSFAVNCALACWTAHYLKRLLETQFVHRFSNATMPFRNIFKNCGYYWAFTVFISYFINHPLYTHPFYGKAQVIIGLIGFIICEIGNLSVHLLLRNLRPPGTKVRKIPVPNANPLTFLFKFVSCPNYTYEVGSWLFFSIMTQSLPALIFTVAGFIQMAIWAKGKHRNYKREFSNYPKSRRSIIPFIL